MEGLAARRRGVIAAAYIYLTLPICIYFIGWLRPLVSIPMTMLFIYGTVASVRNMKTDAFKTPPITLKQFIVVALMITAWVFLAGVGGFVWQNRFDHVLRNAVFQDLVNYDWPVINETTGKTISYYIGFWMPSALIGKAFGMEAGYVFQLIWALLGTGLAFCLMSYILNKFSWVTMLLFIFFSGLDIVPFLINSLQNGFPVFDSYASFGPFYHMEIEFFVFNSSCNTSMLFWMYNYAIPFWVVFLLILLQKNNRCLLFTYSLMALFAPIPMVGALPVVIYKMFHNEKITLRNIGRKVVPFFKNQFNLQNIAGIAQAGIIALFLATNDSAGHIDALWVNSGTILWFAYFFMVEFGIYLLLLFPSWIKNKLCIVLMCSTAVLSFVIMGGSYDFSWRITTSLMMYLMIFVINKLIQKPRKIKRPVMVLLILTLLVGAVTPVMEMGRTIYNTALILIERQHPGTYAEGTYEYAVSQQPFRNDFVHSFVEIEGDDYTPVFHNFICTNNDDNPFNKYLRK